MIARRAKILQEPREGGPWQASELGWSPRRSRPRLLLKRSIRLGDGYFACTGGWPSVRSTHLGGERLGLPPTGRKVEMRVADWYRLDANDKIVDNWVMIDVPYILAQMGLDLFHDLEFRVDRALLRQPLPAKPAS